MKNSFTVLVMALILSGCMAAPVKTGEYSSSEARDELAKLIFDKASECWAKDYSLFDDAIVVENKIELRGAVITARRSAPDVGYLEPFIIVIVSDQSGSTEVEVQEGDYALSMRKNFTVDVDRWVKGDLTCKANNT